MSKCASEITQVVVNRQNVLRRRLNERIKSVAAVDVASRDTWRKIVSQLNHERAVWFIDDGVGKVWQLSATEGPHRERRRLERAMPRIKPKFVRTVSMEDSQKVDNATKEGGEKVTANIPLLQFFREDPAEDTQAVIEWLHTHEQIYLAVKCRRITPEHEATGEFLISKDKIIYVGDVPLSECFVSRCLIDDSGFCRQWPTDNIKKIHGRWFGLVDCALEVSLTNGETEMFAFVSNEDRQRVLNQLEKLISPFDVTRDDISELTAKWQKGDLSNFAYLMALNSAAGRTFNDLMQYPVFPFILSNYTSGHVDLTLEANYRNLAVPISVQSDEKREMFEERYFFLDEEYKRNPQSTAPYHYGSHYSNSGTVLHFLLRLPPFTQMFLEYQDQSFDLPDRTFHSMETAWRLASHDSATDVKELIPEFFFLPEFLLNNENFNFGIRQNGRRVHHVTLPPWSNNDARLFIFIHRQALESSYVSANLPYWIDLVFGFKQRGNDAVKACNVFHPMTYFGVDTKVENDPVEQKALETMIKTYGQTPRQLFTTPHPHKTKNDLDKIKFQERPVDSVYTTARGLKWGVW